MKRILSLASFVCAILFAAAGMMMPPQGEISGSVLILVAQLLILCATFLGIKDYHNIINRKLSWLKILKTSGASSSTLLWPPSPPCSRPLVSPSGDTPSRKPMNRPVWFVGVFLSTDHTENTECLGYGLYFSCLSARCFGVAKTEWETRLSLCWVTTKQTIGKSLEEIFNKNMAYGQKSIIGI